MLKGVIEGCVLKIIADNESYSAQIVALMRERGFANFSEGTLYPLLLRLEKEGYLLFRKEDSNFGPSRKYYSLSGKGKIRLKEFITDWEIFCALVNNILE